MTAQELKQTAWEMDATASALSAHIEIARYCNWEKQAGVQRLKKMCELAADEAESLQVYADYLQAEAAKAGAA